MITYKANASYEAKLPKLQAVWEEQGWANLLVRDGDIYSYPLAPFMK